MRLLDRIDRFWLAPAPAQRLAAVRVLSGLFAWVYITARMPYFADYTGIDAGQFRPIGVVKLLVATPLPPALTWLLALLTSALGAAFVAGYRHKVLAPLFALLLLWLTTYRSSWGMLFHTENLMVLHIFVLALVPAADAYAWRPDDLADEPAAHYGWPIRLLCTITVLSYVIAGVSKLRHTGVDWVTTDFLRDYIAYDALRKVELGSLHSPIGSWLLSHPVIFKPLAAVSLALEIFAPLALLSPRLGRGWAFGVIGFHWGVLAFMAILFPYPAFGIGLASFFEAERLINKVAARLKPSQ